MAIFGKPNLPHEYSFSFKLFQISNQHTHHHSHKFLLRVFMWKTPYFNLYLFTTGIRCSPPFMYLVLGNSFIILFPGKIASKLVLISILSFFCIISLQSNFLNVNSKNFENKVRISGIGKDNGSFTGTNLVFSCSAA